MRWFLFFCYLESLFNKYSRKNNQNLHENFFLLGNLIKAKILNVDFQTIQFYVFLTNKRRDFYYFFDEKKKIDFCYMNYLLIILGFLMDSNFVVE